MQFKKRRNSEDSLFEGISQISSILSLSESSYDSVYEFEVNSNDIKKRKPYHSKKKKREYEYHERGVDEKPIIDKI